MTKVDLPIVHKAETGSYPNEVPQLEYIEWLENKIYQLTETNEQK